MQLLVRKTPNIFTEYRNKIIQASLIGTNVQQQNNQMK